MKSVSDEGKAVDQFSVVRYHGVASIRKMMDDKQYVEAFVHAQLAIEKVLWDKIVGVFSGEKAMKVRGAIDDWHKEKGNTTRTSELLKWARLLEAIDIEDCKNLSEFNKMRNRIVHRHGQWWFSNNYVTALKKGIRFLENNGF